MEEIVRGREINREGVSEGHRDIKGDTDGINITRLK